MKLLCLNLWGGRQGSLLTDYLKQESASTDIFCFQEVFDSPSELEKNDGARMHLWEELKILLPGFQGFFAESYSGWIDKTKVDFPVRTGQAIFVKRGLEVKETGNFYVYGDKNTKILSNFENEPKNVQYAKLLVLDKEILILNVHGKWHPGNKLDTPERIEQSKIILDFLKKFSCPKIVCGDFNLMPNTKSIAILEEAMENLISTYKITNTRNKISWEENKNIQHFADFTFVSPDVRIKSFRVPYNEVSDHLPMLLEFDI